MEELPTTGALLNTQEDSIAERMQNLTLKFPGLSAEATFLTLDLVASLSEKQQALWKPRNQTELCTNARGRAPGAQGVTAPVPGTSPAPVLCFDGGNW